MRSESASEVMDIYFTNRHQFTEINWSRSLAGIIMQGVPQRFLLGPELFTIFLNDLLEYIEEGSLTCMLMLGRHFLYLEKYRRSSGSS